MASAFSIEFDGATGKYRISVPGCENGEINPGGTMDALFEARKRIEELEAQVAELTQQGAASESGDAAQV